MQPFTTFRSIAVPIDIANCDTDQIIPARFLRFRRDEPGYDRFFFHDLRFSADETELPEFILNREPFRHGKILVTDVNWGCGSSREHAVYALVANGIRAVIAPSFGDIHYNNCMKNGVLPVRLARSACDDMRRALHERPGAEISIDLENQTVTGPGNQVHAFEIDPFDKYRMLNGLDDIAITREYDAEFERFEAQHRKDYDWL